MRQQLCSRIDEGTKRMHYTYIVDVSCGLKKEEKEKKKRRRKRKGKGGRRDESLYRHSHGSNTREQHTRATHNYDGA